MFFLPVGTLTILAEKFVFVEEAKEFLKYLREFKRRPVIPASEIFRVELEQDKSTFEEFMKKEKEIDEQTEAASSNYAELRKAFETCENEAIDTSKCPEWKEWGEWSKCGKCGNQAIRRTRQGCAAGSLLFVI